MADTSIFDELNSQIKRAEKKGELPSTLTVGGRIYTLDGAADPDTIVQDWIDPATGTKHENVECEYVTLDLAPYAAEIRVNGTVYQANRTYLVPKWRAEQFREIIQNTWRHEAQTGGANSFGVHSVKKAGLRYA